VTGPGQASSRPYGALVALAALLALNACAADGQRPTASASLPARTVAVPSQGLAPVVMPAPQAPNGPATQPRSLVGRLAQDVRTELGAPDFYLREAPAEMWQYRQGACLLEVILYADNGELRVSYAEIRSRHPAVDATACGGLVDQLRGQPATPAQGA
jgi:hypothetical protein